MDLDQLANFIYRVRVFDREDPRVKSYLGIIHARAIERELSSPWGHQLAKKLLDMSATEVHCLTALTK